VLKGTQFLSVEDGMQKDRDSQQTFRKWSTELLWPLAASYAAVCQLRRELFWRRS
jgi:hypothetical protein